MALLLCVLLSGCGTMRLVSIIEQDEGALSGSPFPYSCVVYDIGCVGVLLVEIPPFVPFILADLPVAAVVDTLCLPFDIVSTIRRAEKKRIEPEDSTPSSGSTPSLDGTGETELEYQSE